MGQSGTQNKTHCPELVLCVFLLAALLPQSSLWRSRYQNRNRAALRSKCSSSVCALVPVRCFSTEAAQPPLNSTTPPPFFDVDHSGVTYGKLFGIRKHVLKTDIINFFEDCNLTLEDVKLDYNRSFFPVSTLLQFPTRKSYDNAIRVVVRKGRLYRLDRADRSQWDIVKPYDGKTVRRLGAAEPIKLATVRFHSRTQAMNAYIAKNGTFCQNNRLSIQVLQ
ncbi:hypothetical protein ACSQ67_008527 [Phaseolus vulgaris]